MIKKHFLLLLLVFSTFQSVFSSTANPKPIKFTQPDGSVISITLKGDEHIKWAITSDGYTLLSNSKGYFEYAIKDSRGYLAPSGVVAKDFEKRSFEDKNFISKISKGLSYSKEQVQMLKSIKAIKKSEARKAFPTSGSRKLVCILMGFKDKAFSKTQSDFNNLFNQVNYTVNGATGSVKDYYLENSYGKFNLDVTVAGPYTASQNMSYYGANDTNGDDVKPDVLVTEAVTAADATVNYADFDNDNDGNVDGVYVIYAGYGEEAGAPTSTIWAHAWEIPAKTLDGKVIINYSCSAEFDGTSGSAMTSIGVICHEFGHVLGAPDYYDTDYDTGGQFDGTGVWDLMAGGSWNNNGITPAHHNAYTKVYVYGWASATTLTSGSTISMPSSKADANAFYRINTATANEYYLIENRQQTGFDASIPGHGLLIFHVNKDIDAHYSNNDINANAPQLMYPVCASATSNPGYTASTYGNINSGGCTFPGTSNKYSFTDATMPNMKSWAGENTGKPITNIIESQTTGTISFDFNGGFIGIPTNFKATAFNTSQINLEWTKTDNKDVILAYSLTPTFGSLVDGNIYNEGQDIAGGGKILVSGDATTFSHSGLTNNKTYYYKIWSKLSTTPTYSQGIQREAKTLSGDPTNFQATKISSSQIDLNWVKTENKGVVVASSTSPTFGQLNDATTYSIGQSIPGGGTIIYTGDASSFNNTGLTNNTAYYYKIWSTLNSNPSYSPGIIAQTRTACSGILTLPLSEDFTIPSISECWSIIDKQGNGQVWQVGSISNGLKGSYIYLDSDGYGESSTQNTDLITPAINTTGNNSVTISFKHFFKISGSETATLSYSLDGTNWVQIEKWTTTTDNPAIYKKYLTEVANKPSVKFKWNYTGTWGWFWCIDDISIVETPANEVIANFKAEQTTVNIGNSTTFTNQSNGPITSWDWNFGSGASPTTATTAGPHIVTYSSLGKKTVTLTVSGNVTETKTDYINVIDPNAPVVLVGWNFEDSNTTADDGLPVNAAKTITTTATGTVAYSGGSGSGNAISYTGWDGGNGTKAWQIEFSTLGYKTITLSSKQKSSNSGPKEFKVQYKTTGSTWIDVPSSNITVANDAFALGVLSNIALPEDAENQPTVSLRWVMRSNLQVSSGNVASGGTSRIDDIVVNGKLISVPVQHILTVSKTGNGTVTPTIGDHTYNAGTSVTLTATPDAGWQFEKWVINGTTFTSASTQITINANTTAVATFTQITYKLTIFHIGNGTVFPVDGESTHNVGESVTLTATPDQGWQFVKWEINGYSVNSASTQITINANTNAVATFSRITYKLTVSHVGNGSVSPVDGESTHNAGESVTLTATPDQGWQFEKWEINGNTTSSSSTQITINANTNAVATFSRITYKLTVSHVGNGSVSPVDGESTHNAGESVTLTATPDQGWQFEKWEINGNTTSSSSTQITINANTNAIATFSRITYKLTVSHFGNGSVSPVDGESTYNAGESVTLIATPDQGWQFEKWEINGNTTSSSSTQISINANTTAIATFSIINSVGIIEDKYKIYPNPTNNLINIESEHILKNIQVLDLIGCVRFTSQFKSGTKTMVDLSHLQSGIYLIRIVSQDDKIHVVKVSKR